MSFTTKESLYVLRCISESQMEFDHEKLLEDQNLLIYFEDVCDEHMGFKVNLDHFFMGEGDNRALNRFLKDAEEINENG